MRRMNISGMVIALCLGIFSIAEVYGATGDQVPSANSNSSTHKISVTVNNQSSGGLTVEFPSSSQWKASDVDNNASSTNIGTFNEGVSDQSISKTLNAFMIKNSGSSGKQVKVKTKIEYAAIGGDINAEKVKLNVDLYRSSDNSFSALGHSKTAPGTKVTSKTLDLKNSDFDFQTKNDSTNGDVNSGATETWYVKASKITVSNDAVSGTGSGVHDVESEVKNIIYED